MRRLWFVMFTLLTALLSDPGITMGYEKEIERLSSAMTENIAKGGKKTIAVVDFTDLQGNVTELGRFIAEEFSASLAGAGRGFEVIDRTHLKVLLKEHKLAVTDIMDPSTARKLGQIAGVDALITGTITPFGDTVRLSVKILDTTTAKVIGASRGNIAKTKAIEELLARGIETGALSSTGTELSTVPRTKAQQRVEAKGFIFHLRRCEMSGDSITCHLTVTNKNQDRELRINGSRGYTPHSRIFDDSGNEYMAYQVQLGSKNGTNDMRSLLISGIPTKISLSFQKVSTQARSLSLLEIGSWEKSGNFRAQLRNIPLSK